MISLIPSSVNSFFRPCASESTVCKGLLPVALEIPSLHLRMPSFLPGFALNQQRTSLANRPLIDPPNLSYIISLLALSFEKPDASLLTD